MTNKFLSQTDFDFKNKTVLVRIDCDVDLGENFRLKSMLPTLEFLKKSGVKKIVMIGHLGRPAGRRIDELSLQPVADWFSKNFTQCKLVTSYQLPVTSYLSLLENLRFFPGEKANNQVFVEKLAGLGDVYINECFSTSHREQASIVGVPIFLPSFLGLNMEKEIKTLRKIQSSPERPLIFVLGGSKKGKLDYLDFLQNWTDYVLVGGLHPLTISNEQLVINDKNIIIARLTENTKDISLESINKFRNIISQAKTIIWAGPMGVYEEKENQLGTKEVAEAIASSNTFKVAGGGDTHRVLSWFDLWDKFDFVSTGGGAMLDFLRDKTLPGIDAIIKNSL